MNNNYTDDFLDDEIVVLIGENGEEVKFIELAAFPYKNGYYTILQPVESYKGIPKDEALVFEIKRKNDGDHFVYLEDHKLIDEVFFEYQRLLKEAEKENIFNTGEEE
jgi:uncharacterized protein YrzB (UPF0473 family)